MFLLKISSKISNFEIHGGQWPLPLPSDPHGFCIACTVSGITNT